MEVTGFSLAYAGMNPFELAVWIGIGLAAGFIARQIIRGPKPLGLFGDMLIGLIGAFGLGWVLRRFGFDLSEYILRLVPDLSTSIAIWIDVGLTALVGALILRTVMRPFAS